MIETSSKTQYKKFFSFLFFVSVFGLLVALSFTYGFQIGVDKGKKSMLDFSYSFIYKHIEYDAGMFKAHCQEELKKYNTKEHHSDILYFCRDVLERN